MDGGKELETMKYLYEGRTERPEIPLSDDVEFRDPLVLVKDRSRVEEMFRKLNNFYPATQINVFEPIEGEPLSWTMHTHYRKTEQSTPKIFQSTLELEVENGYVRRITEHWHKPLPLRGDGSSLLSRGIRKGIGRLFC